MSYDVITDTATGYIKRWTKDTDPSFNSDTETKHIFTSKPDFVKDTVLLHQKVDGGEIKIMNDDEIMAADAAINFIIPNNVRDTFTNVLLFDESYDVVYDGYTDGYYDGESPDLRILKSHGVHEDGISIRITIPAGTAGSVQVADMLNPSGDSFDANKDFIIHSHNFGGHVISEVYSVELIDHSPAEILAVSVEDDVHNHVVTIFNKQVFINDTSGVSISDDYFTVTDVLGSGSNTLTFVLDNDMTDGYEVNLVVDGYTNNIITGMCYRLDGYDGPIENNIVGGWSPTFNSDILWYYPFDGDSSQATDVGPSGNHGTLVNGASITTDPDGEHGDVLSLTRASSHRCTAGTDYPDGTAWTFFCWIRISDASLQQELAISTHSSTPGSVFIDDGPPVALGAGANDFNEFFSVTHAFSSNTWTFVMAIYDGANMTLYVNNSQIGTESFGACSGTFTNIGIGGKSGSSHHFGGYMSGACLVNKALDSDERLEAYNNA